MNLQQQKQSRESELVRQQAAAGALRPRPIRPHVPKRAEQRKLKLVVAGEIARRIARSHVVRKKPQQDAA